MTSMLIQPLKSSLSPGSSTLLMSLLLLLSMHTVWQASADSTEQHRSFPIYVHSAKHIGNGGSRPIPNPPLSVIQCGK